MAEEISIASSSIQELVQAMADNLSFSSGNGGSGSSNKSSSNKTKIDKEQKELLAKAKKLAEQVDDVNKVWSTNVDVTEKNNKVIEQAKKANVAQIKSFRNLTDAQKEHVKEVGSASQNLRVAASSLPDRLGDSITSKFSDKLGPLGDSFNALSRDMPGVAYGAASAGLALGAFVGAIRNSLDSIESLTKSGTLLNGGFSTIYDRATDMNMSIDQMAGLSQQYTRAFNVYRKDFGKMLQSTSSEMQNYGLTTSETAEYMAEYLDRQRRMGVFVNMEQGGQLQAMRRLKQQSFELATTFGKSVEEIEKGVAESLEDPMVSSAMRSLTDEGRESFQSAMQFFEGSIPEFAKSMQEMIGSEFPQVTQTFQQFAQAGQSGLATAMSDYARMVKDGSATQEDHQRMLDRLSNTNTDVLRIQANAGNQNALAVLKQVEAAKRATEAQANMTPAMREQQDRLTRANTALRNFIEYIQNIPTKIMGMFIGIGDSFANGDWLKGVGQSLVALAGTFLAGLGLKKLISGFTNRTIKAGIVNVYGGSGPGGGGGRRRKRNWGREAKRARLRISKSLGTAASFGGQALTSGKNLAATGMPKGAGLMGRLGNSIGRGASSLGRGIVGMGTSVFNAAKTIPGASAIIGTITGAFEGVSAFNETLSKTGDKIMATLTGAKGFSSGFFDGVIGSVADMGDFITGGMFDLRGTYDSVSEGIGDVLGGIGSRFGLSLYDLLNDDPDISAPTPMNKINNNTTYNNEDRVLAIMERQVIAQEEGNKLLKKNIAATERQSGYA